MIIVELFSVNSYYLKYHDHILLIYCLSVTLCVICFQKKAPI